MSENSRLFKFLSRRVIPRPSLSKIALSRNAARRVIGETETKGLPTARIFDPNEIDRSRTALTQLSRLALMRALPSAA